MKLTKTDHLYGMESKKKSVIALSSFLKILWYLSIPFPRGKKLKEVNYGDAPSQRNVTLKFNGAWIWIKSALESLQKIPPKYCSVSAE